MSRSGYSCDLNNWDLIRWRGAVKQALKGARGQAFLREMLEALDALPHKRLISGNFEKAGQVCALGAVGVARGVDMSSIDLEDRKAIARVFGIAQAMAAEIMFENDLDDECTYLVAGKEETPEERWTRVRAWVVENLKV